MPAEPSRVCQSFWLVINPHQSGLVYHKPNSRPPGYFNHAVDVRHVPEAKTGAKKLFRIPIPWLGFEPHDDEQIEKRLRGNSKTEARACMCIICEVFWQKGSRVSCFLCVAFLGDFVPEPMFTTPVDEGLVHDARHDEDRDPLQTGSTLHKRGGAISWGHQWWTLHSPHPPLQTWMKEPKCDPMNWRWPGEEAVRVS